MFKNRDKQITKEKPTVFFTTVNDEFNNLTHPCKQKQT